jgi:hypothetical protein
MKNTITAIVFSFIVIISSSCSGTLSDSIFSENDPRSFSERGMRSVIDAGCNDVEGLFISYLERSPSSSRNAMEAGIDLSKDNSQYLEVKGIPVYYIDSATFVRIDEHVRLSDLVQLDQSKGYFMLYYKGQRVFSALVPYQEGKWMSFQRIGLSYRMRVQNENISNAIANGENLVLLVCYSGAKHDLSNERLSMICKVQGNELMSVHAPDHPVLSEILADLKTFKEWSKYEKAYGNPLTPQ